MTPPFAVADYLSPTSIRLNISKTQGDAVRVYWRRLPYELTDRVGPGLLAYPLGSSSPDGGTVEVTNLPEGSCILFSLARETTTGLSAPYCFAASTVYGDTIASALGRKWALVPALTLTCGPIFSQEAPETLLGRKLQLPWTICCYEHASYDFTFEGIYYETTNVDLTVYALGYQQIEDALSSIHSFIDWQSLPFLEPHNNKVIKVEPVNYMTASTFIRHRSGQIVWHGRISYEVTVEKNHPSWPRFQLNN